MTVTVTDVSHGSNKLLVTTSSTFSQCAQDMYFDRVWRFVMAGFAYSAINIDGLETVGEIHAPDLEAAREQLRVRGLLAQSLRELPASGEDGMRDGFKKIKPASLQVFSRQFATMIEAG